MYKLHSMIIIFLILSCAAFVPAEINAGSSILDAYLKIGAALSQDQHSEALKYTKDMGDAVSGSNNATAKGELAPAIQELAKSKDLDAARKSYEKLSSNLSKVKKDLGIKADEYYCPMLKKTWLQKDSKIMNPYAGKDMASCGEKKS